MDMNPAQIFDLLDTDKKGFLTCQEFQQAMQILGVPFIEEAVKQFAEGCKGERGDHRISRSNFIFYFGSQRKKLRHIFKQIDVKQRGYITKGNLKKLFQRFETPFDENRIDIFIDKVSDREDGLITFNEFLRHHCLFPLHNVYSAAELFTHSFSDFDYFSSNRDIKGRMAPVTSLNLLISGAVAGMVSRTATAPLDRLRYIFQDNLHKNSFSTVITNIIKKEGFLGFYKGNGVNLMKVMPDTALKFFVFDKMKELLNGGNECASKANLFAAGAVAGLFSQTVMFPVECVRTKFVLAEKGIYNGVWDCFRKCARQGPLAFYRGWSASVLGMTPCAAIDLGLFNAIKETYLSTMESPAPPAVIFCSGALSSTIAQITTYPLAVAKTRLMSQNIEGRQKLYTGPIDCIRKIYRQEGTSGLFKGLLPNCMKNAPSIALSYTVFDYSKRFFTKVLPPA